MLIEYHDALDQLLVLDDDGAWRVPIPDVSVEPVALHSIRSHR